MASAGPIFARRNDGKFCRRDSDGLARRATEEAASCGCGESGPCYLRGACSFKVAPTNIGINLPGFTFTSPQSGWSVQHTPPSGGRWLTTIVQGTFGGVVRARVWTSISPTMLFSVEVKLYASDGVTVTSTHTTTVQGNCDGVTADKPGDNLRWYDRNDNGNSWNGVPTPTAKAVTWSNGSGSFLWAVGDECQCGDKYGRYGLPGSPTQCRVNLTGVVGRCHQPNGTGNYISGIGTPDGEYVLPRYHPSNEGSEELHYRLELPIPAGMGIRNYGNDSTCGGPTFGTPFNFEGGTGENPSYWRMIVHLSVNGSYSFTEVQVSAIEYYWITDYGYAQRTPIGIFYSRKTCHVPGELFYPQPVDRWGGGTAEVVLDDNDFA